jgi:putative lipoprotein
MRQNNKNTLLQMALLCFLGVTSCNNNSKIIYTATQRESDFDKDTVLKKEASKDICTEPDDSLFVQRIIDGNFFQEKISKEQDYVLVVKHCFAHTDEQYDETFADGLSHMLVKYPNKIKGIQKAISLLPIEQQSKANHNMMIYIVSSWIMENYTDSINLDMFYQSYPFFKKDPEIENILKEQFNNGVR